MAMKPSRMVAAMLLVVLSACGARASEEWATLHARGARRMAAAAKAALDAAPQSALLGPSPAADGHTHAHDGHGAHHGHSGAGGGGCGVGSAIAEAHFGRHAEAVVDAGVRYHTLGDAAVRDAIASLVVDAKNAKNEKNVHGGDVGVEREVEEAGGGEAARLARRMQLYDLALDGGFLTVADAQAAGLTAGIRIKVLWDTVEGGDYQVSGRSGSSALQCTRVGSPITVPCETGGSCTQTWDGCTVDDIVGPTADVSDPVGAAKLQAMKTRLAFAVEYFNKALEVKPVQDDLVIDATVVNSYNLNSNTVAEADLVIIMTARPSPWVALNGYASCAQRDAHGRCVVGVFNWVPRVLTIIDGAPATASDTVSSERHTALHEIIHVLGGMNPNPTFIDQDGVSVSTGVYIRDQDSAEWYTKPITKIVTPRVLTMAREHFKCSAMTGMPLEDQPTGRAAHWEARIMGPEVMSYGSGTGETYMGDITFAFLEDTNQYIANYSYAGPLVDNSGDTGENTAALAAQIEIAPGADWVDPQPWSAGALRWGRGQGCDFVQQPANEWTDRYKCTLHRDFGCSFDNLMSAVCLLQHTYSLPSDQTFTCGDCAEGRTTCAGASTSRCTLANDQCESGNCKLPTMYQYFTAATAQAALGATVEPERVGGFSSAMDYVPVRLSYWNCKQANISSGSKLLEAEAGASTGVSDAVGGAADDQKLFGGQAYCENCRCFVSSLMDLTSGSVNPDFPHFGLCYRSNCYQPNYLQFAIENQLDDEVTWYKCPEGGGKIYIAGFSGAFVCPDPADFCQFETISGIKYEETDPLMEWILYATMTGLPTLIVLCCVLIPPCRHWAVGRGKFCCGVNHFNRRGHVDHDGEIDEDEVPEKPPQVPSTVLLGSNTIILCCALFLLGVTVYAVVNGRVSSAGPLLITVSVTTITFSVMGAYGAIKESRGISCLIVAYFYVTMGSQLLFIFMAIFAVAFPESLESFLADNWDTLVDATPANTIPESVEAGGGLAYFEANIAMAISVLTVIFIIFTVNNAMSMWIMTLPVVASTMMVIASYFFIVFGGLMVAGGGYLTTFQEGIGEDLTTVVTGFVCIGLYVIAANALALVGAFTKQRSILLASLCLTIVTTFMLVGASSVMLAAIPRVEEVLNALTDDQAATWAGNLGMQGLSRADLITEVKGTVRTGGLFIGCLGFMSLAQMISNSYFLYRVRKHVKMLNSQKVHVVPYTRNKKQVGRDGEVDYEQSSKSHRRHRHHHGEGGDHHHRRHRQHRHHGERREHGRGGPHEYRHAEPVGQII